MSPRELFEQANEFAASAERAAGKGYNSEAISELATAVACLAQGLALQEKLRGVPPTEGHPT